MTDLLWRQAVSGTPMETIQVWRQLHYHSQIVLISIHIESYRNQKQVIRTSTKQGLNAASSRHTAETNRQQ
uniref:Uncharacterized protein n=1 Tax=Arundo donax TaxID=35708 RepID=A0A0A9EZB2_ARUDO